MQLNVVSVCLFVCLFVCFSVFLGYKCKYPGSFQCNSGHCIKGYFQCDGDTNCLDESDEKDCKCLSSEFTCPTGECLPVNELCDGNKNCGNGSDEVNCGMAVLSYFSVCLYRVKQNEKISGKIRLDPSRGYQVRRKCHTARFQRNNKNWSDILVQSKLLCELLARGLRNMNTMFKDTFLSRQISFKIPACGKHSRFPISLVSQVLRRVRNKLGNVGSMILHPYFTN